VARNALNKLLNQPVKLRPVREFVVSRCIDRRPFFRGDAPHDKANQEVVPAVQQRAGDRRDVGGMPAGLCQEIVNCSFDIGLSLGTLFR